MRKIIIFTFILIATTSCSKKERINTVTVNPNEIDLLTDSLFEGYDIITLETTPDNLIFNIDKIEITDNKFYILDKRSSIINIFDKNGFYISKIDKRGQGSEEYIDITDFTITDTLIYVLSRAEKKIIAYNNSGQSIRTYKLDDYYDYLYICKNNIFLYSNYSNDKLYNVIVSDIDQDNISPTKEYLPFLRNQSFSFSPSPFNEAGSEDLFVCQQYDYNIYKLKTDSVSIAYNIDFETTDKIPSDFENIGFEQVYKDLSNKSVVKRINHVSKYNNFLYITYEFEHNKLITKIDCTTLASQNLKLEFNDIYPYVFAELLTFHKGYLVGYLHASTIYLFDQNFKSDKNEEKHLLEDDNPVLFFHKLKN